MSIQALALHAEETAGHVGANAGHEVVVPPLAFGVVALCILMALLLITFAFRNLGSRH